MMMAEQVEPDTFEPPHHKLKPSIQARPEALLKEYTSKFAQDETSIRINTSHRTDDRYRNL